MLLPLTWNADRETIGHQKQTRFGVRWQNFLREDGSWVSIDVAPRYAGGVFSISDAPYSLDVPLLAGDWASLQSTNRYCIWSKQAMSDEPVGIAKRYPNAMPVAGHQTAEGILFAGAFPWLNADRLVQPLRHEVRDLVVFRSAPFGVGPVTVPLEIDFGTLPILESVGRNQNAVERDFRFDRNVTQGLTFTTGQFRGLQVKRPYVWDSAGKRQPIVLVGSVVGTRFVGRKVIPRSFFTGATYPVFTDTTSTFYPDPNPETTTVDGKVWRLELSGGQSWATVRDGAGTAVNESDTRLYASIFADASTNLWREIVRLIALFDSSALGDGDSINSGSLNFWMVDTEQNDFVSSFDVVASTPLLNTSLTTSDYGQLGTTSFGSLTSPSAGQYNTWALNASGLAAISKTGVSKFGMRVSHDRTNSEPTWMASGAATIELASIEDSLTVKGPYLEVIHTATPFAGPHLYERPARFHQLRR